MLARVLTTVPLSLVDRRSEAGRFLHRVHADLVDQLGGTVTPAQALLVEEAAKTALIARATGEYIVSQATLVRDGALLPIVMQREAIVANLSRLLRTLGLRGARGTGPATLQEYLATRAKGG
jgi:hypothetical protein